MTQDVVGAYKCALKMVLSDRFQPMD